MPRMTQDEVERELHGLIECLKAYQPQRVLLHGSFARGDYHTHSDFDIIVVKDTSKRFTDRIGEVIELCGKISRSVEPMVYTPQEFEAMRQRGNHFICRALREGRVLYESTT